MNSFVVATNVLNRLRKETTVIIFLLVFPVIAALLGMMMSSSPTIHNVGIVVNEKTEPIYKAFSSLKEYNIIKLNPSEISTGLNNGRITMAIKPGVENYKYEILSTNGGNFVSNLENQLLYFNEHNSVYSIWKNNNSKTPNMAIGMFLMFLLMFIGTSSTILLDDRAKRTYMRLYCLPLNAKTIMLGYIIALFVAGIVQISWFVFILKAVLRVDLAIGLLELVLILIAFLFSSIGLAIGLTSIVTTKAKYTIAIPLIAMATTFLSGSLIPAEVMGKNITYISYFIPHRYVIKSLATIAGGGSVLDILPNLGILLLFCFVLFSFGVKTLNKEAL